MIYLLRCCRIIAVHVVVSTVVYPDFDISINISSCTADAVHAVALRIYPTPRMGPGLAGSTSRLAVILLLDKAPFKRTHFYL